MGLHILDFHFRWPCGKSIKKEDIKRMKAGSVEFMCELEMEMPPTFFEIMPYLVVHLVEEVELARLIHARWLYFLEWYMLNLKNVKLIEHPLGSMVEGIVAKGGCYFMRRMLLMLECMDINFIGHWHMNIGGVSVLSKTALKKQLCQDIQLEHLTKRIGNMIEIYFLDLFVLFIFI